MGRFLHSQWMTGAIGLLLPLAGGGLGAGCASKPALVHRWTAESDAATQRAAVAPTVGQGASEPRNAASEPAPPPVQGNAAGASAETHGEGSTGQSKESAEERKAALDKRLNSSLDSFDEKLRHEQQKTAQERDAHQTVIATLPASESGDNPEHGSSRPAPTGASRRAAARDGEDARGSDLKSDRASGNSNAAGNGAVALEVPDGNDDDVVARRLRKAAEQETDPELKDKLWKEYVEYKKNVQTR